MGESDRASEVSRSVEGRVSISILEGAMWFQEDRIQRDSQEPEPCIYAAGQLQPVRLCQSRTEFVSRDGGDHPTLFRRIDGQQSRYLFLCAQVQFWCLMHQPSQVTIGIQAVYFRGFNHTIYDGAGFRASGHIGEQEILSSHHKGFDAAFSPIVADFKPAILQIVEQMRPVLSRVLYCLAQQ